MEGRKIKLKGKTYFRLKSIEKDRNDNKYNIFFVSLLHKNKPMEKELINRLKVVLAEKNRTNKWLADQLGKDQGTVSKWVTNTSQPDLKTLIQISQCLGVGVQDLLRDTLSDNINK